jgi:hypothetical protein
MSELGEDACAVGTIRCHLALVLIGEPRQGGGEVEGGLGQGDAEQEAHGTQTQGQQRQRGPGRAEWAAVTVPVPRQVRRRPPLSPVFPEPSGRVWWRGP